MKTFFKLTGAYEGLHVRRLRQFGRVVFYRVIPDDADDPYWLIQIKNFTEADRSIIRHLSGWGNGTFRFAHLKEAEEHLERLCGLPKYAADEIKRQNSLRKQSERLQAMQDSGRIGLKFLARQKPPLGSAAWSLRQRVKDDAFEAD
jgi:hypothetical protein